MADRLTKPLAFAACIVVAIGAVFFAAQFGVSDRHISPSEKGPSEMKTPTLPAGVPQTATFRGGADGGYFITLVERPLVLQDGRTLPAFEIGIYHSFTGNAEYTGTGLYVAPREVTAQGETVFLPAPDVQDILNTAYYGFGALEFPVPGSEDLGRIVPLPLDTD